VSYLVDHQGTPINTATINQVAGSSEGTRRLRELRSEGFSIKAQNEGRTWFYTLTRKPAKKLVSQYV
jgi:hypothetical protein